MTTPQGPDRPDAEPRRRDRDFERDIHDGYERLIDAFITRGFDRKEARLWVGAWRHVDNPATLAGHALSYRSLRVEPKQAIPWYWARIPPHLAQRFLGHRWTPTDVTQLVRVFRGIDPTLSRREALALGLRWADTDRTQPEALRLITYGYTPETADRVEQLLAREFLDRNLVDSPEVSTLRQWHEAGIPPTRVIRYLAAGITRVEEARVLRHRNPQGDTDALDAGLNVMAALRSDPSCTPRPP